MENNDENSYYCDDKYFQNPLIKLTDFGFFCHNSEQFNESFGTRYYMAPEIILMGPCNDKVDIWAIGCMLYELVTGEILFDPHSDERGSTNFHHLEMIVNLCGNFNKHLLKKTEYAYKYFKKDTLIDIIYDNDFNLSLVEKINNKLDAHNIKDVKLSQLLASILQIDPKNRPTVKDLLKNEWLNS
jgi:serine/threonine protein kinase